MNDRRMNDWRMNDTRTTAGAHRMADPYVRTRTALMLTIMTTIAWVAVTLLGRAGGPYAAGELPDLAGLPVLAPQIERLIAPRDLGPAAGADAGVPTPTPPGGSR